MTPPCPHCDALDPNPHEPECERFEEPEPQPDWYRRMERYDEENWRGE